MKVSRNVVTGLAVAGCMVLSSGVLFAEQEQHEGKHASTVKLLQDSAAALQTSHPDLAAGLTQLADQKTKEMQEKKAGKKETEESEAKNSQAWKARHTARVKLLQDSAAALQTSHPDLAAGLTQLANRKPKKMGENKTQGNK